MTGCYTGLWSKIHCVHRMAAMVDVMIEGRELSIRWCPCRLFMVKLLEGVNAVISRLGITFLVITKMCLQTEATKKVFAVGSGLIFVSPCLDRYETKTSA